MTLGFPTQLIAKLCCTSDGAALELGPNCQLSEDGVFVRQGTLRCCGCSDVFPIDDGILNMLKGIALDDESKHEQQLRNENAVRIDVTEPAWQDEHNSMEMISTLEALSVGQDKTMLELGCGDGRYTVRIAGQYRWVLAVDFSLESLRILQQRLNNGRETRNVALVLGDVKTLKVSAANFDCVLSTLTSNLPTREHRNAMYRLAANALKSNGRFVFSTHNHGLRQRRDGEAKAGRYEQGGIYRYNLTVSECKAEVRPYFEVIKAWPIQIYFAGRLRLPLVALSRFLEHIPLIRNLGGLVLCTAEQPIRAEPI